MLINTILDNPAPTPDIGIHMGIYVSIYMDVYVGGVRGNRRGDVRGNPRGDLRGFHIEIGAVIYTGPHVGMQVGIYGGICIDAA